MNMKPSEKVKEGGGDKSEYKDLMRSKLKRRILVGKREGNCSTPSPTWDFGLIQPDGDGSLIQNPSFPTDKNSLSARKLGANLWEVQPLHIRVAKMNSHLREGKVAEAPAEGSSQTTNRINSRKHVPASLIQRNQRVQNAGQAQQTLSPSSYCSLMEMAPRSYSPTGSLGSKGKVRESNYSLKTSTDLLKVLNRIWSLEEKHALDMSLVKALKKELDQSQAQIKVLLQEKERDHKQIDDLTKQISEDIATRKNKEHERIKHAVKLVMEELDDEKKIRRKTEKLCHKLAQELSELKSSYSNALRKLDRERKARGLREELCDEFAKGVKEYEQEVRLMKHKSGEEILVGKKGDERLILHMSEAWLDERMQMLLENAEKPSLGDKLSIEIEMFLREKQTKNYKDGQYLKNHSESKLHLNCLESLNERGSGPWNWKDEDDSTGTAIHNPLFRREIRVQNGEFTMQQEKTISDSHSKETKLKPRKLRTGDLKIRDLKPSDNQYNIGGSSDQSTFAGPLSPVKKWTSEITPASADPGISVSSLTKSQSLKPITLKAKLLEARLEGQQSRATTSKGVSHVD